MAPVFFAVYDVPSGSLSRGGDVAVYVFDIVSLPTPFYSVLVSVSVFMALTCISFHKFSRQLSTFSLCPFGPVSPLLVLPTIASLYESLLQP